MAILKTNRGYPVPDRQERATVPAHLLSLANAIDADVATVVAGAAAGSSAVDTKLTQEVSDRKAGDTAMGVRVDGEKADRTAADIALGTRIDTEKTDRSAADTALSGRISQETADRAAGDTALGSRIDDETTARTDADTALGERITRVEDIAGIGEGSADDATTAALVASDTSDTTAQLAKKYAPATEVDERKAADTALSTRVTATETYAARIKALEDFINNGTYGGTQYTISLSGFNTAGQPISQPMMNGNRAINWSGTLQRSGGQFTITGGTWVTIGTIPANVRPKAGTEGNGLGQIDGKSMTVRIGSDGAMQVWSIATATMNNGTGLNFAINWVAA